MTIKLTDQVEGFYWYQKDEDPTSIRDLNISDELDYKYNLDEKWVSQYVEWENTYPVFANYLKCLSLNYRMIQTGYAPLYEPRTDNLARSDSKLHVWVEPIFSLIQLGNSPDFFELRVREKMYIWE